MKMIKVDDDIHAELKKSDKSINKALRDLVFGKVNPLESLSGQVKLMFDLLVDMDSRMVSQNNFSENIKEPSGMIQDETNESYAEKDARLRRENIKMLQMQEFFKKNPECEPQ